MRITTITLSLATLASALTATANTFITEKTSTRFSVIPAQYTSDDQPKWTFFNRGVNRRFAKGCSFEITNRDFTQSKTITPVLAENALLVVAEGMYDYYNGSFDSSYFYATQTLFNNDDKYEYMVETLNNEGHIGISAQRGRSNSKRVRLQGQSAAGYGRRRPMHYNRRRRQNDDPVLPYGPPGAVG